MVTFFCILAAFHKTAAHFNNIPNETLVTQKWDNSTIFRQNFCDLQDRYYRGEIDIRYALEGLSLNVGLINDPDDTFLKLTPTRSALDDEYPGLIVELLDEIAKRGKFDWRHSFTIIEEIKDYEDKSWTEFGLWMTDVYDIGADWFYSTAERAALGLKYPKAWYDGSAIMVGNKKISNDTNQGFKWDSWTRPFTPWVWICMAATLLLTGIILVFVNHSSDVRSFLSPTIYQAFMVFTGHYDIIQKTAPGQIISFSLSFFAMLMLSAYTANLASFLVVNKIPSEIDGNEILTRTGSKICILKGSAVTEIIKKDFPNAILIEKATSGAALTAIDNVECDFGVTNVGIWRDAVVSNKYNEDCNLVQIGGTIKSYESGFILKADSNDRCTSFIADVIDIHMKLMHEDGFTYRAWGKHVGRNRDVDCSFASDEDDDEDDDMQLSLINVGGIFVLHACFLVVAIVGSLLTRRIKNASTRLLRSITSFEDETNMAPISELKSNKTSPELNDSESRNVSRQLEEIRHEIKSNTEQIKILLDHFHASKGSDSHAYSDSAYIIDGTKDEG